MEVQIKYEGKTVTVEIPDAELEKLVEVEKKTGYERSQPGEKYYFVNTYFDAACREEEVGSVADDSRYESANYYTSGELAGDNARADRLLRQLRRFAAEHREGEINWDDCDSAKYAIIPTDCDDTGLRINLFSVTRLAGAVYFDKKETAAAAIEEFKDELTWYFTEYRDSL